MNQLSPGKPGIAYEKARIDYVPADSYISPEYVKLEFERLWPKSWQMACREEEVPSPGDFYTYNVADQSITVLRDKQGQLQAFHNVCPHRGRRLTTGCGRMGKFHCKYHGWQWDLNGKNLEVVYRDEWGDYLNEDDVTLVSVKLGTWGGWIWINMDPDSETLEEFLQPAKDILDPYHFEKMRYRWRKQVTMPCNWKTALEAFNEAYHVQMTHMQLLTAGGDDVTYSKAYGKHGMFGAPVRLRGLPSPRIADEETRKAASARDGIAYFMNDLWQSLNATVTERMVRAADRVKESMPVDADPMDVLKTFAQFHREEAEKAGIEWPTITPDELAAGGIDWHIFPNMVFLQQATHMLGYRARPNGTDPDSCIFEIYVLEKFPEGQEPKNVEVEYADDWKTADFGLILSQDFQNMEEVQQGMKSIGFKGARPNPVQERAISNFHEALQYYLFEKN